MKTFSLLILMMFSISGIRAQSHQADSVLQIVKKHPGDTTGVKALLWLGDQEDNFEPARNYYKKALRLSEKISSAKYIAESCIELGKLYHVNGQSDSSTYFHRKVFKVVPDESAYTVHALRGIALDLLWLSKFDSARINLLEALDISKKINDASLQAGVRNDLGNLSLEENNNVEALQQYIAATKLYDSALNDPVGYARTLFNIGNIEYKLKNFDKALEYTNEALQIATKNQYEKGVAYGYQVKGRIYRSQEKFDEALTQFMQALEGYQKIGDKRSAAETELSVGNTYFDLSDLKQAEAHYINALNVSKEISNQTLQIYVHSALAYTYYAQKQYKSAIAYTDSSRLMAQAIDDQYSILDAYNLLREIYEEQHQYKEALHYSSLHSSLKDSLSSAENRAAVEELEFKYQNEKTLAEIELLKSDQSRHRVIQAATIIVLLLVVIVAVVLVNRYRVVNRVKRQVEIERVRNGIARDLHDDIGSTLSSINILSQVALSEKNGNVENYLKRIGDQSSRMMEDIGDIVWSINPNNDTIQKVITHMREFATEILEPKNITYQFTENITDIIMLDADKRKNIFLIFKESINNAAKYSHATQLTINLHQQDHTLSLHVKDNGIGFEESSIKAGNGLKNLRERAREINGKVTIKSMANQGTEIELIFPLA